MWVSWWFSCRSPKGLLWTRPGHSHPVRGQVCPEQRGAATQLLCDTSAAIRDQVYYESDGIKSSCLVASSPKLKSVTLLVLSGIVPPRLCPFLPAMPSLPIWQPQVLPHHDSNTNDYHPEWMLPFEFHEQAFCKLPYRLHHYNPWEGATCRTYFHWGMLSLLIAAPVRNITLIQTGVLTSVSHQALVTFITETQCPGPSLSSQHREGKHNSSLETSKLYNALHQAFLVSHRLASFPSPVANTDLAQVARSLLFQQLLR